MKIFKLVHMLLVEGPCTFSEKIPNFQKPFLDQAQKILKLNIIKSFTISINTIRITQIEISHSEGPKGQHASAASCPVIHFTLELKVFSQTTLTIITKC